MAQEIAKLEDCTDKQRAFVQALKAHSIVGIPAKDRFRWAATSAGYSENTSVSEILGPLRHLIKDIAEQMLSEASIYAAWQVTDAITGGEIALLRHVWRQQGRFSIDLCLRRRSPNVVTNQ